MLVPLLDAIIRCTAQAGTREVVIGMAHRGRLNVLAHVLGKSYEAIWRSSRRRATSGPPSRGRASQGYTGDEVPPRGAPGLPRGGGGDADNARAQPEPPRVRGPRGRGPRARAQEQRADRGYPVQNLSASLAILIHGDAAFPGQGIVSETLNLSQNARLPRRRRDPHHRQQTRSASTSARDALDAVRERPGQGLRDPDRPRQRRRRPGCIAVARMACAYREHFGKDFLIDLIGYRRYGTTRATRPNGRSRACTRKSRPTRGCARSGRRRLEKEGVVSRDEAEAMGKGVWERLQAAKNTPVATPAPTRSARGAGGAGAGRGHRRLARASPGDRGALLARPEGFTVNPRLEAILQRRRQAFEGGGIGGATPRRWRSARSWRTASPSA